MQLESIFTVDIGRAHYVDYEYLDYLCKQIVPNQNFNGSHPAIDYNPNIQSTSGAIDLALHRREPALEPLVEFIEHEAKKYWDSLGYYPDVFPRVYQSWINVSTRGGFVDLHNHCRAPISVALYLRSAPGSGNIVFENPLDLVIGGQPIKMPYRKFKQEVDIKTGDMVMFPGYLKHCGIPNATDDQRIVFVANLNQTGT